jgi:5-(carboxyamino)imidazole ribonucleotide synthase
VLNELTSRPHNAGHLTIEASTTSQFENHLRAVLDLPLGSTEPRVPAAAMVNVLGAEEGDPRARLEAALSAGDATVHLYDKEPRAGRKLGHVTATGTELDEAARHARRVAGALTSTD